MDIEVLVRPDSFVLLRAMSPRFIGMVTVLTCICVLELALFGGLGLACCDAQVASNATTLQSSDAEASRVAKVHFQEGQAHFAAGRFREAAQAFEQAYQLLPAAELRFNIGRAYEEFGDYAAAVRNYEAYLQDAQGSSDKSEVQSRVDKLRARFRADETRGSSTLEALATSSSTVRSADEAILSNRSEGASETQAQLRSRQVTAGLMTPAHDHVRDEPFVPSPWFWGGVVVSGACFVSAATFAALPTTGETISEAQANRRRLVAGASLVAGVLTAVVSSVIYLVEHGADATEEH